MQIVENKALVFEPKDAHSILSTIKKSSCLDDGTIAVRWGLEESQALADLGYHETPTPIHRDYNWPGKYKPFDHQRVTSSFLTANRKSFCFSEQGCGKTASVIWAADYLLQQKRIRRVLVVCPLSIMRSAWQADLFRFAMHRSCAVAYGEPKQRKKLVEQGTEFVVINYDGLGVVKDELINGNFDLVVADEASYLKNANTNRWKMFKEVAAKASYLWLLTGTPAAQSPLDAYGIAKLINPTTPRSMTMFRDKVMMRVSQFKWVPKPGSDTYVHELLQPAIRFAKDDCLDLPPVLHTEREAPMTAMQKKYYDNLKRDALVEAAGETISAVNAAAGINKLLQVASGCVYTDSKGVIDFDVSNRLNAVLEAVEESSNKVLVFVPYTHTIDILKNHLEKHGITCGVINGAVSMNRRTEIVERFQTAHDPHVLIIQPQAAAHGLTLTAANTIIWYAPITSVETYLQANARINRPGQKNNMLIIHIHGSDVERKLYDMLQNNITNHEKIIDLYKRELEV